MDVELVAATREDLPQLFDWMRQLRVIDPMETEAVVTTTASQQAMRRLIDDKSSGHVWLIRADSKAAGYVVLVFSFSVEFGGRTAFIDELFIEEPYRGQGIGRRALELVTKSARSLGVQNLLLEVSEGNVPARQLYTAAGFVDRKYRLMSMLL
jgi:GNAT superfamily N-acetyltransferase